MTNSLTEGFKRESKPKIEIFRAIRNKEPLCCGDDNLIAFVTDTDTDIGVPKFGLEEIEKLTDLIERKYL